MPLEIFREAWAALGRKSRSQLAHDDGQLLGNCCGNTSAQLRLRFPRRTDVHVRSLWQGSGGCWPGTTSEQVGGERAGKAVRFEQEDADWVKAQSPLVKARDARDGAVEGHYARRTALGHRHPRRLSRIRRNAQLKFRWKALDLSGGHRRAPPRGVPRRHTSGRKLFSGTPAIGETVRIDGVKFTVVGSMDTKFSDSNYFTSDDESVFIPYTTAGDLWDARYASVMLFEPVAPNFEANAMQQFRAAIANRQPLLAERQARHHDVRARRV